MVTVYCADGLPMLPVTPPCQATSHRYSAAAAATATRIRINVATTGDTARPCWMALARLRRIVLLMCLSPIFVLPLFQPSWLFTQLLGPEFQSRSPQADDATGAAYS